MTTTDPRTILAEMQVIHDAALSSNANRTLGKTLAAITEVLDLHYPISHRTGQTVCGGCPAPVVYPCPTVTAITEKLGGDRG